MLVPGIRVQVDCEIYQISAPRGHSFRQQSIKLSQFVASNNRMEQIILNHQKVALREAHLLQLQRHSCVTSALHELCPPSHN